MKRRLTLVAAIGLVVLLNIAQTECPQPPFDASGDYEGQWWGQSNDMTQEVVACPLTMHLEQDLTAKYPKDHEVRGVVTVDYSCLELPEWVGEIPPSEVNVVGLLEDDNKLSLVSGGCGTGLCVVLALAGQGEDTNSDGLMDAYSGSWSFTIMLAGVQPFGVTGGYSVARSAE